MTVQAPVSMSTQMASEAVYRVSVLLNVASIRCFHAVIRLLFKDTARFNRAHCGPDFLPLLGGFNSSNLGSGLTGVALRFAITSPVSRVNAFQSALRLRGLHGSGRWMYCADVARCASYWLVWFFDCSDGNHRTVLIFFVKRTFNKKHCHPFFDLQWQSK